MINENTEYEVYCIRPVYINDKIVDLYKVGNKYNVIELEDGYYDDKDYILYCYSVYLSDYNYYQFNDSDFKYYFCTVTQFRNNKIGKIIN